jgi:hypothetical protein
LAGHRSVERYEPGTDATQRHGEWSIRLAPLFGLGEVIDVPRKLFLIDPAKHGDRYAMAHAIAHLDLEHVTEDGGGAFTAEEEADADGLARLRLDDDPDDDLEDDDHQGDLRDDDPSGDLLDDDPQDERIPIARAPRDDRVPRRSISRLLLLSCALGIMTILLPSAPIFDPLDKDSGSAWATGDVREPAMLHCSLGCPGDSTTVRATNMQAPKRKHHADTKISQRSTRPSASATRPPVSTSGSGGQHGVSHDPGKGADLGAITNPPLGQAHDSVRKTTAQAQDSVRKAAEQVQALTEPPKKLADEVTKTVTDIVKDALPDAVDLP